MAINALPPAPSRTDPANFAARSDALLGALAGFVIDANALQTNVNAQAAAASTAQSMRDAAQASANYKGIWASMTGALSIPASVYHDNNFWILTSNLADVTTAQPGISALWSPVNGFRTPLPSIRPTLLMDFVNSQTVDSRITFTRASTASKYGVQGLLSQAPAGVPRIDYDPVTLECKGLLIEEARTNFLLYSEQIDNAAWSKVRSTVSANATMSPDGSTNADRLTEDSSASTDHYVIQSYASFTYGTTYTVSVFAKADSRSIVDLWIPGSVFSDGTVRVASFNLATGAIVTGGTVLNVTMTPAGNGWYRCSMTFTATAAGTVASAALTRLNNGVSSYYSGDGTSGLYVWGGMLETGSFLTSYIPTTSAAATRAADLALMTGANFSGWFRQQQQPVGTLVIGRNSPRYPVINAYDQVNITDGTINNSIYSRVVGDPAMQTTDSGITAAGIQTVDSDNPQTLPAIKSKSALAWGTNDMADTVNGGTVFTDGSVTIPAVSQMQIGSAGACWFTSILYYPARLSNATLQAITAQ